MSNLLDCFLNTSIFEGKPKQVIMIELKPLKPEDITPFYTWLNDKEVINYSLSFFQKLSSKDQIKNWFESLFIEKNTYNVGIFLKSNQQLIGYTGISNLSKLNKSGEYFIFIGDKSQWGKGIGTIVTKQVVCYGFKELDLNRIMLTVSAPNIGGVKAYEKAGFVREGILREACFRDGEFHDKVVMSILKSDLR